MKIFRIKKKLNAFCCAFYSKTCRYSLLILAILLAGFPSVAIAEISVEVYGGFQTAPHSVLQGKYKGMNVEEEFVPFKFSAGWNGKSFSMPPYYGIRITNWNSADGWGLDFTHSKAYADKSTLEKTNFELLQFTDGLNNLTLHQQKKLNLVNNKFLTYYGYGIGIIVPHVEFQVQEAMPRNYGYQYGGPTVALNGGIRLLINEKRFVFAEYKFTASWLDVNLKGGGNLQTRILTNALNLGLGFEF